MRGDEAIVVRMFHAWLDTEGRVVEAVRDTGLDIHTAYGRILCRQGEVDDHTARYG
ncbi:hypothetical protein [Lentzea sp. NPDC055074]